MQSGGDSFPRSWPCKPRPPAVRKRLTLQNWIRFVSAPSTTSTDPAVYSKAKAAGKVGDIPTNHNPGFAPVIHPTLKAGVEAMVVAAQAWLSA